MDCLIARFPHIAEQIFCQLDNKSLTKCREVTKSWQKFIDDKNLPWIRIVNVPTVQKNGDSYLHVAGKYGQTTMFLMILEDEDVNDQKNYRGNTPFHNGNSRFEVLTFCIQN